MADLNHCYRKNEQILCKELEGAPVLIDPYRRTLITLNPVGFDIWQLLDGEHSALGIINNLKELFDIDEKHLEKDVINFLEDLAKREIIL